MANHYETLGVRRGCTQDEIRSAYRKMVLQHHPDRSSDPKSKEIFMRVTEAYEVLSDRQKRFLYDQRLSTPPQSAAAPRPPSPRVKPKAEAKKAEPIAVELTKLVQLFSRGRMLEAEAMARDLTRRAPREAIPYGVLGDILRARGNLVEAAKMYAFAAQFDPRNPHYQKRHEELIQATQVTTSTIHIARDREARVGPLVTAAIIAFLSGIYLVLSRELPILPSFGPISTFTLGLVGSLFFCGVSLGAAMALGGWLDTFDSTTSNALGRRSPTVVLGFVAIVNFWAAGLLYLFIGLAQRAFNYSTSRVVGSIAGLTLLMTICAGASYAINAWQVLIWGGNLSYLGALGGWMVADAFRR